ncbi:tRNA(Ile)-lysidine synthetase [Stenotrophomonas terrae]|uniref:tRNA(Ile)-lysidine synthase n=1 Tax=Stenotrophomonas terrae TaxID=405446 RepID=A0A0R0CL26_9GAMM|nr:tRNA lysidine(34) synthetase TilS [Stenotrophomonas terrae]KRG70251.1 tRNA(Ile)-lysidine synthetase [Stenotrophomonas terrae]
MTALSPTLLQDATDIPVMVGFSGGLDSTVLLHLLANAPGRRPGSLRAVHVHHGLQAVADHWQHHCSALCAQWNIPLQVVQVEVPRDSGHGLEAAARDARHAAFKTHLQQGEWLALAHHQDDQAETFLLRALRGAGVDGLGAMQAQRSFGSSTLWKPLLQVPRSALETYASQHRLHWIEDPSNDSADFDRNFLRLQVLPLLRQRWPHASAAMARSAGLAAQAAALLHENDAALLQQGLDPSGALQVAALRLLAPAQQSRLLRLWVNQRGLPALPANGVLAIQQQLLASGHDQQAEFRWQQARIVRWREQLHALPLTKAWPKGWTRQWDGSAPAELPDGGKLLLHGASAFDQPVQLRQRQGGERIQLTGRSHSHQLKHRLQQSDVPPWLRAQLPLLCDGDTVLAAADRVISAPLQAWLQAHGAALEWQPPDPVN